MRVLALDISTTTGWALGESQAEEKPRIDVERIREKGMKDENGDPAKMMDQVEAAADHMGPFIRNVCMMEWSRPDLIAYEAWIPPFERETDEPSFGQRKRTPIQRNMNSILTPFFAVGALRGVARCYGIPLVRVANKTWVKHFTGQASHGSRAANKAEALKWAIRLGYLPAGCRDTDMGDAAGIWDYAASKYGRRVPKDLALFDGGRLRHA